MASLLQTGVPVLLLTAIMALFFNPFHLLPGVVILGTWTYICHLKDKLKNCSYPDKYQREFLERKDAHTLERQRELEDKVYRLNRQLSHECESNREALDTIDILKRQLSSGHEAQRKLEQKLDNLRGKNEVLHQRLQHHLDSSHRRIVDALQARIAELERMEETSPASIAAPPITLNQAADVNHNACQQHIKKLEGFLNNANARVEELEKEATTTASRIRFAQEEMLAAKDRAQAAEKQVSEAHDAITDVKNRAQQVQLQAIAAIHDAQVARKDFSKLEQQLQECQHLALWAHGLIAYLGATSTQQVEEMLVAADANFKLVSAENESLKAQITEMAGQATTATSAPPDASLKRKLAAVKEELTAKNTALKDELAAKSTALKAEKDEVQRLLDIIRTKMAEAYSGYAEEESEEE